MPKYHEIKKARKEALDHLIRTHRNTKLDRVKVVSFMQKEVAYWEARHKKIATLLARAKAKGKTNLVSELEIKLEATQKSATDAMGRYELEKKQLLDETNSN